MTDLDKLTSTLISLEIEYRIRDMNPGKSLPLGFDEPDQSEQTAVAIKDRWGEESEFYFDSKGNIIKPEN